MIQFKLFGIRYKVSFVFAAYITLLLMMDRTGLIIPTLFSVAVHEFGHAYAMVRLNIKPYLVELSPCGCIITAPPINKAKIEIIVALLGPLFNLISAVAFLIIYAFLKYEGCFVGAVINAALAIINLLPVLSFDGGTIFVALTNNKPKILATYFLINKIISIIVFLTVLILVAFKIINISAVMVMFYVICCQVFKI